MILNNSVQVQPQVLTAIDETNFAIKQLLGFSVGYYGSVIQVSGDSSFANQSTWNYTSSGLGYVANTHADWGAGFSIANLTIQTYWFNSTSYSTGYLDVTYNLTKLGIYGMQYAPSCGLTVQTANTTGTNQTTLIVTQDQNAPVTDLQGQNFKFFNYLNFNSTWQLISPSTGPVIYANGTYLIQPPTGINVSSYVVQVQDQRGIIVVASQYSSYTMNLTWPSPSLTTSAYHNVTNNASDVDANGNTGTESNFTAQQYGPDNINDTLAEANVPVISGDTQQFVQSNNSQHDTDIGGTSSFPAEQANDNINDTLTEANTASTVPETYVQGNNNQNPGSWTNPQYAYDGSTTNAATKTSSSWWGTWSGYLVINLTATTIGTKIRYMIGRSDNSTNLWTTMTVNVANQTGSWTNVYSGTPVYMSTTYQNLTFASTMTYTAIEFQFYRYGGSSSATVSLYEVQAVNATYTSPANYQLDLERQWTSAQYNVNASELLCIKTGTLSSEPLEVDAWNGTSWKVLNNSLAANAWNNMSVSPYLTSASFTIRFIDTTRTNDPVQSTWQIDTVLLHTWNSTANYQLDIEEQWTNANYTGTNKDLDIFMGPFSSPAETLSVQCWNATNSSWATVIPSLNANNWNNISVTTFLTSSTFTIRFLDGSQTGDSVQNSWQIDATLLRNDTNYSPSSAPDTLTIELLQNGTMRWLGQSLQLTTQSYPIPPLPTKSIHLNQTINGVNSEVPFQIEDWSPDYLIPLGLTSNSSIFNNGNMIVFLANNNVSKVTIWWNGSDLTTQTPYAYVDRYFAGDNSAQGRLTNGVLTLQFTSASGIWILPVVSSLGSVSCTATFMRINSNASTYGASMAWIITSGVVRDIVQQEAEWGNGITNCPNVYSQIVLTLPANATYYTYQLRLIFVQSQQNRSITDICPIELSSSITPTQTENGNSSAGPIVSNGTGLFFNQSTIWAHHWSQFISGTSGAGMMFTDSANSQLYAFDTLAKSESGNTTGCLRANSTARTIELLPVEIVPVNFTYAVDTTWYGAVSTFNAVPLYQMTNGLPGGSWIDVEYPPTAAVFAGS
jgi:hypothetical protein